MPTRSDKEPLRITAEDLAGVVVPVEGPGPSTASPDASAAKSYGSINDAADRAPVVAAEHGSFLLQGWFYLGAAGLLGAMLGWALCEPGFVDGVGANRWGNLLLLPAIITFMCIGFGVSESMVERSLAKALLRGVLALPLGIILGFIFQYVADIIYNLGLGICAQMGVVSYRNPAAWIARGIAWAVFGAAGGTIYGIVGQSFKKAKYGIIGGLLGAALGGTIFDPIAMATKGGAPSRAVGFALVGIATGVAMGLVESALKDRWLYVTAGPLAGKQFILYKARTRIGSDQKCDIYLFKDSNVLPEHAVVEIAGTRVQLRSLGPVYVSGQPTRLQVLQSGNSVQIGRYAFR